MASPTFPPRKRARLVPACTSQTTLAAPRAAPLVVVALYDAVSGVPRVDVRLLDAASGAVVARLDGLGSGHLGAAGGMVCLVGGNGAAVRVLDLATGAVADTVPGDAAAAHGHQQSSYVFGQVPSTGEYKLLRVSTALHGEPHQSCEILTLGGGGGQRWRPAQSPPAPVAAAVSRHRAVAHGVAHFLASSAAAACDDSGIVVASFDLATEAWRPLLRGPHYASGGGANLSLAALQGGRLAVVRHDYRSRCIDMWALAEDPRGTGSAWSRMPSLRLASVLRGWEEAGSRGGGAPLPRELGRGACLPPVSRGRESVAQPLAALDDGRMALWVEGRVRVYDPRTGGCTDVADMGRCCNVVGLCTA